MARDVVALILAVLVVAALCLGISKNQHDRELQQAASAASSESEGCFNQYHRRGFPAPFPINLLIPSP